MKTAEATAVVFVSAIEALARPEREAVLRRLFATPGLRDDLMDVARWHERRAERAVPYERIRERLKKAGRL